MRDKNNDLVIRRATRRDAHTAIPLLIAQLRGLGISTRRSAVAAGVRGLLDLPRRGFILLAIAGGAAVGVAYVSFSWTVEHGGQVAWLEELYVAPRRRGGGIGKRLLAQVCALARRYGCNAVELEVENGHARAESLYARERFRRLKRRRWSLELS